MNRVNNFVCEGGPINSSMLKSLPSLVIVVGDEWHFCDGSRKLLTPLLRNNSGSLFGILLIDVGHTDVLFNRRAESSACGFSDLLAFRTENFAVASHYPTIFINEANSLSDSSCFVFDLLLEFSQNVFSNKIFPCVSSFTLENSPH